MDWGVTGGAAGADMGAGAGRAVVPGPPLVAGASILAGPGRAGVPLPARSSETLRTSSAASKGLRSTSSDLASAACSSTVPLTMPEISSTGTRPSLGCDFTKRQIS
jgi:hypothetical protein